MNFASPDAEQRGINDVPCRTHFLAQKYAGIALANQFVSGNSSPFRNPSMARGVSLKPGTTIPSAEPPPFDKPSELEGPMPRARLALSRELHHHQPQRGSDSPEIGCVAGHNRLPSPLRTNNDMCIPDVSRAGSRQQQADSRGIGSVERNQVRTGLSNQPR